MKNKKKKIFIAIGIICAILSIVGVSYALWMFREVQTKKNLVQLDCFNVEFNETSGSNIQLSNAFPLTDQQGKELDPYQFSISNLCGSFATYQVRIEVKKESKLDDKYLKVMLNQNTPNVLTNENYENSDILIGEDTKRAYIIETGYLKPNEVKNYDLRLWLDENVTTDTKNEDETSVQKSKWSGIITISSSYSEEIKDTVLAGKAIPVVEDGDGLYEVLHNDATSMEEGWQETEYRYAGSNPNNYVWFNDELWRIIGLVNVKTKSGITQRLKIVKSSPVANDYWDNESPYENDWTKASLMKKLNEIDGTKGQYYETLKDTAINMISEDIIWNIGGTGSYTTKENGLAKHFYGYERGTSTENSNTYPSTWPAQQEDGTYENVIARVGLIYPSDYGYAVGGTKENRNTCLDTEMYIWNTVSNCNSNDWLKMSSGLWTISPSPSRLPLLAFVVGSGGYVNRGSVYSDSYGVAPVVYLSPNTKIVSGTGTINDSYKLEYTPPPTLEDIIKNTKAVDEDGNGLYVVSHKDDGTDISEDWKKDELRYGGVNYDKENPETPYVHNYVTFNKEVAGWRIIGLVNVLVIQQDGSKKVEQRLKIIRDKPESKAWDSGNVNDWTQASLMKDFNDTTGEYYQTLTEDAIGMIDKNIIWNLGGISDSEYSSLKANEFYKKERGTEVYQGRPTEWPKPEGETYTAGKALVGLMYPSDYGYAVGGGKAMRDNCLTNTELYNYDGDCHSYDWLFLEDLEDWEWLLSPNSSYSLIAFLVDSIGDVGNGGYVDSSSAVRPVVYLNPDVIVSNSDVADGSVDHPYELALE